MSSEKSYEFLSVTFVAFDFVLVEDKDTINRRLEEVLKKTCKTGSHGASYWTGRVNHYLWDEVDPPLLEEILRDTGKAVGLNYDIANLRKHVKHVRVEGYELERPPIYIIAIIAPISETSIGNITEEVSKELFQVSRLLRVFVENEIQGVISTMYATMHPRAPIVAQYDVRANKDYIHSILDNMKNLFPTSKEPIPTNKVMKTCKSIRSMDILHKVVLDSETGLLSVLPQATNFVTIIGQTDRFSWPEFPNFIGTSIIFIGDEQAIHPHETLFLPLLPNNPIRKTLIPMNAQGSFVLTVSVFYWLRYLENLTFKYDNQLTKISNELAKIIEPNVSLDILSSKTIEISHLGTEIHSFIEEVNLAKRVLERALSTSTSKDLVPLSMEMPIFLADPWFLVGTDYYKRSSEGFVTLIAKEILDAFDRVGGLFVSLEQKLNAVLGYTSRIVDIKTASELLQSQLKYLGRSERVAGDLIPKIVKDYFEGESFHVEEANPEIDQIFKIDLICKKGNEVRLVQVKKGQVSKGEIREVFERGRRLIEDKFGQYEKKIIEIVASEFPDGYIEACNQMSTNEISLTPTHLYQILRKSPKYRYLTGM